MKSLFIGAGPAPIADPWAAVEAECPAKLGRQAHAGRLHIHGAAVAGSGRRAAVRCIAWRPLSVGERATDAWTSAALHRVRRTSETRLWIGGDDPRCVCRAPDAAPGECHWCGCLVQIGYHHAWPLEVPGAREAEYPPPEHMRFQMSDGVELAALAEATAAAASAYYARVLRPAPAPCRAPRRPAWARAS